MEKINVKDTNKSIVVIDDICIVNLFDKAVTINRHLIPPSEFMHLSLLEKEVSLSGSIPIIYYYEKVDQKITLDMFLRIMDDIKETVKTNNLTNKDVYILIPDNYILAISALLTVYKTSYLWMSCRYCSDIKIVTLSNAMTAKYCDKDGLEVITCSSLIV